ncbi:MAG: DNA polymerase III subunit delta [Selenomonadaceae bacterium]|nr:DNA polymerase III subunit delta [Selenomonadaceae bacterium]
MKQVFLLAGDEDYYIEKAKNKILEILEAKNDFQIFEKGAEISDIIMTLETPPLFSPKTVVIVKSPAFFKEDAGKTKDKEMERFMALLSSMPDSSYIMFILNEKPDKRRKIYKSIEKIGLILESESPRPWTIGEWLTDKLRSIGKTLDKDAYLFFMNMISAMQKISLAFLDQEFDKLALYTDEKRIDKKTMEEVFSSVPEVSSFAIVDAISEKDLNKALTLFHREVAGGAFLPLIIALISRHTRQLFQAKLLMKQGIRGKTLAKPLELNPVIAEKLGTAASRFDERDLEDALILLSDADYLLKTGQGGNELIEEILILLCKGKTI